MELYLIRHGIAAERGTYTKDEERPLTEAGRYKTRQVAKRLDQLEVHFDLILTSPLVRAEQTAEILRGEGLTKKVDQFTALAPQGSLETWLDWLADWQPSGKTRLALVGHQPDLGNWAEILVWGEARERLVLKKAGIIGLTLPSSGSPVGNSEMFWLAPPKLLL